MGELIAIVQIAFQVLTPLITAQIPLISGVGDDVNAIQSELQGIIAFLKQAEQRGYEDDGDKEWVRRVRVFAYEIQDATERYLLYGKEETLFGKCKMFFSLPAIASTIKDLRGRALDIGKPRYSLSLNAHNNVTEQAGCSSSSSQTTSYHLFINAETQLVGTETPKEEIIQLLGLKKEFVSRPSTVVVLGMRGLGKTTVAGSIYNDNEVKGNFPTRAWITVSSEATRKHQDMFRSMMQQFHEETRDQIINKIDSMGKKSLVTLVQQYLKDKRYLIVFDDVPARDVEFAAYIKSILPTNERGSKILVTTRYQNVAHKWLDGSSHGLHLYKLKPLSGEKAWDLFRKKAFGSSGGRCPTSLHDLAQGVVRKCGGLPPAILAIGRLLSRKADDLHEWENVHSSLGFYLEKDPELSGIYQGLLQNYRDLPYHLKPCFLYFGLFHKGYPIDRMRLIRLWIAEGFIEESRDDLTLEDIAEQYMNELIDMSLVEVRSADPTGRPMTLGVANELLHEILLVKLDELSFCQIHPNNYSFGSETTRRLSIHKNHHTDADKVSEIISKSRNIRCLFLFDPAPDLIPNVLKSEFFSNVRLLKVLDLCNAPIGAIPDEVGKLLNLHYLSLRKTRVKILPSSLGKLQSLQTLDLKQTLIYKLPKEIDQLYRLRHLLSYSYEYDFSVSALSCKVKGFKIPAGALGKCCQLQKLAFLDVGAGYKNLLIQLKNLRQLRKLGIVGLKPENGNDLCSVIQEMKHLQTFIVFSRTQKGALHLENMKPPRLLKRLSLNGQLMSFPTWIPGLESIAKIHLKWSNLTDDPLEKLQALPNLVELLLLEAYSGKHLKIQKAGFQKLKILHLLDLNNLMSLTISKGALSLLEELSIGESGDLQMPSGIKYLTNLKTLKFYNMPPSFCDCLQPGALNHSVIKHVPDVVFYSKHPQGYWDTSTLR